MFFSVGNHILRMMTKYRYPRSLLNSEQGDHQHDFVLNWKKVNNHNLFLLYFSVRLCLIWALVEILWTVKNLDECFHYWESNFQNANKVCPKLSTYLDARRRHSKNILLEVDEYLEFNAKDQNRKTWSFVYLLNKTCIYDYEQRSLEMSIIISAWIHIGSLAPQW